MRKNRKRNTWIEKEKYYIGLTSKQQQFIIDKEDISYVENYTWYIQQKIVNGKYVGGEYIVAQFPIQDNKRVRKFLHNIIWEANYGEIPKGKKVDHIDRNPRNNRKDNLRLVSQQSNAMNRNRPQNNTSGFIGVSFNKAGQKWIAYITIDKKRINLGVFDNKEEAIKERLKAEKIYFQDFAPQRHLFKEYDIE